MAECRRRRRCCCYSLCLCLYPHSTPCLCSYPCSCPCPPFCPCLCSRRQQLAFLAAQSRCCYRYCCQRAPHSPPCAVSPANSPAICSHVRQSCPASPCCPLALLRFKLCLCLARKSINALNELQKTLPLTCPTHRRRPPPPRCSVRIQSQFTVNQNVNGVKGAPATPHRPSHDACQCGRPPAASQS